VSPGRNPEILEQGRGGVPQIVKPDPPELGSPIHRVKSKPAYAGTSHVDLKTPHSESPEARPEVRRRGPGPATRRDSRDRAQLMRSAAGGIAGEEEIMTAIRAVHVAPRRRASPQNGLPEHVPYVYGQQTRRNTYAARIAQRNAHGWWKPPAALPEPKLTRPQAPAGTAAGPQLVRGGSLTDGLHRT
jgi:hypothetical protein